MVNIYVASKTKHAAKWRALRAAGVPVVSSWIDEEVLGDKTDPNLTDWWETYVKDVTDRAGALLLYVEPGEVHKGGLVEVGAALGCGIPVYVCGPQTPAELVAQLGSWTAHPKVVVCGSYEFALSCITKSK